MFTQEEKFNINSLSVLKLKNRLIMVMRNFGIQVLKNEFTLLKENKVVSVFAPGCSYQQALQTYIDAIAYFESQEYIFIESKKELPILAYAAKKINSKKFLYVN